jgi:uncharacterized protein YbjT (DUF2867 family)
MSEPILVTGAAGGSQGSAGRRITALLLEKSIPVRVFVHKLDARSDALQELGAEVVQGDLLDRDSVRALRPSDMLHPKQSLLYMADYKVFI